MAKVTEDVRQTGLEGAAPSLKPVMVYLANGSTPESLIALHAMLSFHEQCAFVVYEGDFSALLSRYLANPFVKPPWSTHPLVFRDLAEARARFETTQVGGIIVQASNSSDLRWRHDVCAALDLLEGTPPVYLDMADEAGKCDGLASASCRYLKGAIYREFPLGGTVEPAPYLHWGLSATGPASAEHALPRPIDVCFLGSQTTHASRKAIVRLLEDWSGRHAETVKVALYVSEPGDLDRPSQAEYVEILRQSKICIDLWGHSAQTRRLYEGLMAGCLVLSQSPRWLPNAWTPIANEHFGTFGSGMELARQLEFFLEHEGARSQIASNGNFWVNRTFAAPSIGAWLYMQATGCAC